MLEHARLVNLDRAANMPNFVVDEIDTRYFAQVDRAGRPNWRYLDTLEAELTVRGNQTTRVWRKNGQRATIGFWPAAGGFGTELKPLFSPECPTTLTYAGKDKVRGRPASVYRFTSPAGGCFGFVFSRLGQDRYNAARSGRVLLDDASGAEVQYEEEATGLPASFQWIQRNEIMSWDNVKIGDATHWLPVSADFVWRVDGTRLHRASVEYKNHRHFEAGTSITYK